MLEDVTGEGAMRTEEAIRRKRATPDDESGRPHVAMEVAARNPNRPFQYGGSSSSWEVRPEPSRRRDAEEQLGGDVVRERLQDPQALCEQERRRGYSLVRSSICKHGRELGALHVAEFACAFGEVGGAPSASSQVRLWTCGIRSTGVLEDVTCRTSRVGDWIASESNAFTLDQRRT